VYKILEKKGLTVNQTMYKIDAPHVAAKVQPGQFVIVRAFENGERVPLTPLRWDREEGWVDIIVLTRGKTTKRMEVELEEGGYILDIAGPLGNPAEHLSGKKVLAIGIMTGLVEVYPIAKMWKEEGNSIVSLHVTPEPLLIMKDEFEAFSDRHVVDAYPMTETWMQDMVTHAVESTRKLIEEEKPDMVFIVGPTGVQYAVFNVVKEYGIPMEVDLHPIMVDGTGMCGACRVHVGGEVKFACVDGPAFDAYKVDFEELIKRNGFYSDKEKYAMELYLKSLQGGEEGGN